MQPNTGLPKGKLFNAAFLFLAFSIILCSCKKGDDGPQDQDPPNNKISYTANFVKSSDGVTTPATGTVTGEFNVATRELSYTASWSGLTSKVVDMHFHDAGPVIVHIKSFAETVSGQHIDKATFTETQAADLGAGKIYIQIHTENYPGGEIIAVLTKKGTNPDPNNPDPQDPYPSYPPY